MPENKLVYPKSGRKHWRTYRARVAALSRDRLPDDPELVAARRDHFYAQFERYALESAHSAPLTQAQADKICRMVQRGTRNAATAGK